MNYKVNIVHNPSYYLFLYDHDDYVMTERYPKLDKENVQNKIHELNKKTKPYINKNNCFHSKLKHKIITMSVINIETARHFSLTH